MVNTPQWKELIALIRRADRMGKRVEIRWVKGHRKDPHNKRVDKLAKQSAKTPSKRTLAPARVRRKKSPNKVNPGSVRMEGQVTTIHVIVDQWLPAPHKCYRYMYEVMEEESPYYQRVDKCTSDIMLGAGHTYVVRFNADRGNPLIVEMLEEVTEEPVDH